MKHLLKLADLSREEILSVLNLADQLKYERKNNVKKKYLEGKHLGMIFQKSSTRTRVSFEVGMSELGGQALFLSNRDLQIGRGEPVEDTARVLSRYLDGIMIRTFAQKEVEDLAKYGSIPIINGLTVFFFQREKEHDLNIKGAYLHMLADTLVSIGVVLSGILILWTGWNIVDPMIGLVIAVVILFSTWGLLKESVRLAMDGVPEGIQVDDIREHLLEDPNVKAIHHLHIWPISTTENALTAHVVLNDLEQLDATRARLHEELAEHGISHATLEFESPSAHCPDEQKLEC